MNLPAVVEALSGSYRECTGIWAGLGLSEEEREDRRQELFEGVVSLCQSFLGRQRVQAAELDVKIENLATCILETTHQLGQSIVIPDAETKIERLRILEDSHLRATKMLAERKKCCAALVQQLTVLTDDADDPNYQAELKKLASPQVYDAKHLAALETRVAEAEKRAALAVERMRRALDELLLLYSKLGRDKNVAAARDPIIAEMLHGEFRPRHEQHLTNLLEVTRQELNLRVEEVANLRASVISAAGLLAEISEDPQAPPISYVAQPVKELIQSTDITDAVLEALSTELRRLQEERLKQIPRVIKTLVRDIATLQQRMYGEDKTGRLDTDPTLENLLHLESVLKDLKELEAAYEPLFAAIRRYNEYGAMQRELELIVADKTRFTSRSREAARTRQREEHLKKELNHSLPRILAALTLQLEEMSQSPSWAQIERALERDYASEISAYLDQKDGKFRRRYEAYLASHRHSSGSLEDPRRRGGDSVSSTSTLEGTMECTLGDFNETLGNELLVCCHPPTTQEKDTPDGDVESNSSRIRGSPAVPRALSAMDARNSLNLNISALPHSPHETSLQPGIKFGRVTRIPGLTVPHPREPSAVPVQRACTAGAPGRRHAPSWQ
ncbi:Microtubule associated protein [Giardia muris]|uniref:Microtubule associated protein n=1 Tax=Giardia muris TaxID=5742 RepID=A0A4Z1SMA5_GIAMU|nr:Microtubule associated protein [Giardia muris]|eukprot:TNJ26816.1 Microtubule associated protein [Giardia muris]